jgi:hypothetical protein
MGTVIISLYSITPSLRVLVENRQHHFIAVKNDLIGAIHNDWIIIFKRTREGYL